MENTEIYTNITIREERNKLKKFTVCLLIGAMAASMLTGCGSNGGSSDSSDSKADSSSETMTIMMNGLIQMHIWKDTVRSLMDLMSPTSME